jgi:hypothetical protein
MSDAVIPVLAQTRIVKFARVRRERMLPVRGAVMVTAGNRVGALDVVAKANTVGNLRPVPLARYLRTRETALEKYLLKQPGEDIAEHEIIASKPESFGMLRRIYRAPKTGRIAAIQGAWLVLDLMDAPLELRALYRGTVINVMARQGVVIEATGALVQGVWGAGGEGYGVLRKMVDAPDAILDDDKIDVTVRGTVLLAGSGVSEAAIRRAAQERATGLIVGGLAPQLRHLIAELALPTLVTEGFGARPMSSLIFDLLTAHIGEETVVNTPTNPLNAIRPEVFIPILATGSSSEAALPLPTLVAQVGVSVRVVGGARLGEIGTIAEIPTLPCTLESGVGAWGAEIALSAGDRLFVPWENLELIG